MSKRESDGDYGEIAAADSPELDQFGGYVFDKLLIIRLVLASLLFAAALILKLSPLLTAILLIFSAAAAGYDIVVSAVNDVSARSFFGAPMIVTFTAVLAFAIGFGTEGAALVILYRIGLLLIDYTSVRTRKSAMDFIQEDDADILTHVSLLFANKDTGRTALENKVRGYLSLFTKLLLAVGVLYAIILPLISDYTYAVSIHRGLTLMIIATPLSVLSSMPLADIVGIGFSAGSGVVYNNSASFDATSDISTVVFDKDGVFSNGQPKVVSVKSDKLDPKVFLKIAAHIAYKSKNPLARGVAASYDGEIIPGVADDFVEIPGLGAEIKINGISLCLGKAHFITSMGTDIPEDDMHEGSALYMSVAGRYVGYLTLAEEINPDAADIVADITSAGADSCILLTGDSSEESARLAKSLGISEYFAECDRDKKLSAVDSCRKSVHNGRMMYVYSEPIDCHSPADIDASVGTNSVNSDMFLTENGISWLSGAITASRRSKTVALENVAGTMIIKALIIALTLTGFCNLWFAVFLDMAAALGAILNTIRVSMPPLFTLVKKQKR